jgi:hypothetical protein
MVSVGGSVCAWPQAAAGNGAGSKYGGAAGSSSSRPGGSSECSVCLTAMTGCQLYADGCRCRLCGLKAVLQPTPQQHQRGRGTAASTAAVAGGQQCAS